IYKKYLDKMLKEKKAFYCWHTKEELDKERGEQTKQKQAPRHICSYRNKDATKKNLKDAIIRFKNDTKDTLKFNDLIRDEIKFESENFGDFSIAKSLTEPLYNFAVVIDDYQMKVTHIIRGEDHIPNTPRQILLQQALGMPMPKYAHLPLILGSDKSKLSKRHGATSVTEYKKLGYLPDALFNFLAILGWRGKNDEKEILDRKEIIQEFLLEDVQKSGAIFDVEKLNWMNGEYIRKISLKELTQLSIPYLTEAGYLDGIKRNTLQKIQKIIALEQTRMKKLLDIVDTADFFFKQNDYDITKLLWKDMRKLELQNILFSLDDIIKNIDLKSSWDKENLEKIIMPEAEKLGDRGKMLWPLRYALSGKDKSPGPFEIMEIIGKEATIAVIKKAQNKIAKLQK
ncbi:MAG: glutamate--tRNA ligase, partial [Candidatus Spechtbacteria bacterium RIFCSPLOWO2_01_FULL_38_20]